MDEICACFYEDGFKTFIVHDVSLIKRERERERDIKNRKRETERERDRER